MNKISYCKFFIFKKVFKTDFDCTLEYCLSYVKKYHIPKFFYIQKYSHVLNTLEYCNLLSTISYSKCIVQFKSIQKHWISLKYSSNTVSWGLAVNARRNVNNVFSFLPGCFVVWVECMTAVLLPFRATSKARSLCSNGCLGCWIFVACILIHPMRARVTKFSKNTSDQKFFFVLLVRTHYWRLITSGSITVPEGSETFVRCGECGEQATSKSGTDF